MIKIDEPLISRVSEQAEKRPRLRQNYNFHRQMDDTLQRLLNAIEPYSYIQPHKHEMPDKREVFFILRGRMAVIEYDAAGNILDHIILDARSGNYAVEIPERTWHSIISLEPGSVSYEFKDGPYDPIDDKNFATWAPREGEAGTHEFILDVLNRCGIPLP
jgi:cupin fold WbuC family metalloprotein